MLDFAVLSGAYAVTCAVPKAVTTSTVSESAASSRRPSTTEGTPAWRLLLPTEAEFNGI